ncbi:unnamed protein product [Effrenium voratum]|nr:unnamed protein product [Effrenium voratum]
MSELCLQCDGSHVHEPWNATMQQGHWKFATSVEAEYPAGLARCIAQCFRQELSKRGVDPEPTHASQAALASQKQHRKISRAVVPEFAQTFQIQVPDGQTPPMRLDDNAPVWLASVPKKSKLIRIFSKHVDGGVNGTDAGRREARKMAEYGSFFEPRDFTRYALDQPHPTDELGAFGEDNWKAICWISSNSALMVAKFRLEQIIKYKRVARDLRSEEIALHQGLHPDLQTVLAKKQLLLFKRLCEDAGIDDEFPFRDLCEGFKLVGQLEPSGQFRSKLRLASMSAEELQKTAPFAQACIEQECRKVLLDPEVAAAVWKESVEQATDGSGWLKGPFTKEEVTLRHGPLWIPSRRFGVRQSGKIRSVDDFSKFGINASTSTFEQIVLEGIDDVGATARMFVTALDGSRLEHCRSGILGRALDLKAAYKQLARHPDHAWCSIIAAANPNDGEVCFFEAIALPFGAVSSVLGFSRVARCLSQILVRLFRIVNTNFFDDYCQLEVSQLAASAHETAETVLQMLGWNISMGEDKRKPFSSEFDMLGATVVLDATRQGLIVLRNKPGRIEEIRRCVSELGVCWPRSWTR